MYTYIYIYKYTCIHIIPHDCSFTECHSFGVTKCPLQLPSHKRKQFQKKIYIFILGILLYGQAFYKKSAIMYG